MNLPTRVAAALLLAAAAAHAEDPFSFEHTPGKLPKTVVPLDYAIRLAPDVDRATFDGTVRIRLRVREKADELVLNALALDIKSAALIDGTTSRTLAPKLDAAQQTLVLPLDPALAPGEYTLEVAYSGIVNEQTFGLFRGRYRTARGEAFMLGTQLQPADARRVVPSWDEPAFRATFQLTVDLPAKMRPYSNMPVERTEALPGKRMRTHFQRTPRMASYLLVLVAGDLERIGAREDGVDHGVVTLRGKAATARYALDTSRQLLKYFNEYFGLPYPLPKLDHYAVTGTAGFGAMENWGGILYNEALLLFDPATSSDLTRRYIFGIVAHEMAHMWFGDLVTMAWWDNLWLNEGFASWLGAKATQAFNPDWGVWQRAVQIREAAMSLDARKTTHPIQQPVTDEAAAVDAFDVITYIKGQVFLRMLESWLGEDVFRAGMRGYIAKHQFSNTTTADLWAALEEVSGKPVRRMAEGWTEQGGFPVVRVDAECDDGVLEIELAQAPFTVDGSGAGRRWHVPVVLRAGGQTSVELLARRTLSVERGNCDGPLIVDPEALGYYRVEYAPALRAGLVERWSELGVETRLKLLADTWALAGVDRLPPTAWLELVQRARHDTEPTIWNMVASHLDKLDALARGEPQRPALRRFAVGLLRPQFDALGWTTRSRDSQQVRELRARLLSLLGRFGDEQIVREAQARFARFLAKPSSLPGSLADPVVEIAGRYADAATHARLLDELKRATGAEQQYRFLRGLCAAEDPALAQATLALTVDPSVSPSLGTTIPRSVANQHLDLAWLYARTHHEAIRKRLTAMQANDWFAGVVASAANPRVADELEAWTRAHLAADATTVTQRIADGVRFDAKLKERLVQPLAGALSAP